MISVMKKRLKKTLVMLLSVAMVFTMMAMPVYAGEAETVTDEAVEEVVSTETVQTPQKEPEPVKEPAPVKTDIEVKDPEPVQEKEPVTTTVPEEKVTETPAEPKEPENIIEEAAPVNEAEPVTDATEQSNNTEEVVVTEEPVVLMAANNDASPVSLTTTGDEGEEVNSYAVAVTPTSGMYGVKDGEPAYIAKQKDGSYAAMITLKSARSDMVAIGTKEEAEAHSVDWYENEGTSENSVYVIPVESLDCTVSVTVRNKSTNSWSNPYEYTFDSSNKTESDVEVVLGPHVLKAETTDPAEPEPSDPTPTVPSTTQTLADGTYKVLSTTDRKMFYLYPKETDPAYSILKIENGKMTATITLNGEGYDYVYMGTPEQAKAAGSSKWIKANVVNGYYTFTIPVSALDTKLTITPHSSSYEADPAKRAEAWRPDKWIIFYSGNAIKIADGTNSTAESAAQKNSSDGTYATSGKQTSFKNDKKKDKVSKWSDDSGKSTRAVNSSTTLPDGVYTPDSFSWSGGSGRLAYIRCDKITVTNGKAYATIVFGSSSYDQLKANGRIYYKNGGGNSTFVIPVNLNANNTIIGRTTAMSQPHWVKYSIYIGKAENAADAAKIKEAMKEAAEAKMTMAEKAPEIAGLKAAEKNDIQYAKYFKLFNYENGVKLLSVDISTDSALKEEYSENAKKAMKVSEDKDNIEYDDEGNIVAKSSTEAVEELYHYNVVNYLLVPEDYEVPAGLDKEYIIVRVPAKNIFAASEEAVNFMDSLGHMEDIDLAGIDEDKITNENLKKAIKDEEILISGNTDKPDYAKILKSEAELSILPGSLIPEAIDEEAENKEELEQKASEMKEQLETLESRFTALGVPVLIDRSAQEEDELAQAEWVKVYGALFGCEEEAGKIFDEQVKEAGK